MLYIHIFDLISSNSLYYSQFSGLVVVLCGYPHKNQRVLKLKIIYP